MSQQVLKLKNWLRTKRQTITKKCILLQKIAFLAFFGQLQIENCFFMEFYSIFWCSNLFSILEKICVQKQFSFCSLRTKAEKAKFWSEIQTLFVNDARFARKHFWAYSKLVGTPCKRGLPFLFLLSKFNKKSLLGSQSSRARLLMQLAKVNCRQHRLWGSCHHFPGVVIQCLSQYDLIP